MTDTTTLLEPANRTITGTRGGSSRFVKGKSGNPTGRPKQPDDVKLMLKSATAPAVQLLIDTMNDPNKKPELRIKCAELLIERTMGKAVQPLTADISTQPFNWDDITVDELRRLAALEEPRDSESGEE